MRPSRWDEWREPGPVPESEESGRRRVASIPSDERHHERRSQYEPVPRNRRPERGGLDPMPLFPVGFFTPGSPCPHYGPIPEGSEFVCMVCFQYGRDGHPSLKETAADKLRVKGWEPEGGKDQWGRTAEATVYDGQHEPKGGQPTRKQKRAAARPAKTP